MSSEHTYAVTFGSRGGKKRMASLTPEQRKALARKAARARWGKTKGKPAGKGEGK